MDLVQNRYWKASCMLAVNQSNPLEVPVPEKPDRNQAFCHRCQRVTGTVLIPLSSGHLGICCCVCRATRKGRPYAKKNEYQPQHSLMATEPKGEHAQDKER